MFGVGTQELLVILLVVLLLFGGRRIPEVARSIGSGLRDFRKAMREVQQDVDVERWMRETPETPEAKEAPPGETPGEKARSTERPATAPSPDPGKERR